MPTLRLALAQINPTVGDLEQNSNLIIEYIEEAETLGADVVAFPELAVTGYPPEDLLLRDDLFISVDEAINQLANHCSELNLIIGYPRKKNQHIYLSLIHI